MVCPFFQGCKERKVDVVVSCCRGRRRREELDKSRAESNHKLATAGRRDGRVVEIGRAHV